MPETTTDLYCRGSASSPRLDHVHVGKDIEAFERQYTLGEGSVWRCINILDAELRAALVEAPARLHLSRHP
jgi:hypothetical protein